MYPWSKLVTSLRSERNHTLVEEKLEAIVDERLIPGFVVSNCPFRMTNTPGSHTYRKTPYPVRQ